MTLTTPVIKDYDSVFPGENWFLYWKTSASLWSVKLQELPGKGRIIVPINWSFHSETGDEYDFAQKKPETNLKKLEELVTEQGREIVFVLPLTPAPFIPNGGLPHLLARNLSQNEDGMVYGIVGNDGSINKLYSFFDNRVFKAYQKFLHNLGNYFSAKDIKADVWGMECGYLKAEQFASYFHDSSKVFVRAFSDFLVIKKEEMGGDNDDALVDSPMVEEQLKHEFVETIWSLYQGSASRFLNSNWEGTFRCSFLGGDSEDFFDRLSGTDNLSKYSLSIFNSITKDVLPSSVLLSARTKQGLLESQLNDLVTSSFQHQKLKSSYYEDSESSIFAPLAFFELYEDKRNKTSFWQQMGLSDFLNTHFRWAYKTLSHQDFVWNEENDEFEKIYVFQGSNIDKQVFHNILKIFMNGGKIIFDHSGLSGEFVKRFESFLMENSLEPEQVNLHTVVQNVSLGDGRIVLFEGDKITNLSNDKKSSFWRSLIETFELYHMGIPQVDGIDYYWRTRLASPAELDFEEIRRVSFYNRTSYKKKIKFGVTRNFALMKILDEVNVKVNVSSNHLEIEMLPSGSLSMDFGLFT